MQTLKDMPAPRMNWLALVDMPNPFTLHRAMAVCNKYNVDVYEALEYWMYMEWVDHHPDQITNSGKTLYIVSDDCVFQQYDRSGLKSLDLYNSLSELFTYDEFCQRAKEQGWKIKAILAKYEEFMVFRYITPIEPHDAKELRPDANPTRLHQKVVERNQFNAHWKWVDFDWLERENLRFTKEHTE